MHFSLAPSSPALHIPDGFLSLLVSIVFWALSLLFLGISLRKTHRDLGERDIPLMGVLAAAIFAGQMLNFSIPGGTSGHLMGAALAVILMGPWPAVLVMTAVVTVQALLFQDGGILALGANIFNMGVVGVFVSYAIFTGLRRILKGQKQGLVIAGFAAAWFSIITAALTCALQLALSGASPANIAIPAMAGVHAVIGLGEGLITAGALTFLLAARKDLLSEKGPLKGGHGLAWAGGLLAVLLAVLAPLASAHPDGLEWVAGQHGFLALAQESAFRILPEYTFPGITGPKVTTIAAGITGVAVVFGLVSGIARLDKRKPKTSASLDHE